MDDLSTYSPVRIYVTWPPSVPVGLVYIKLVRHAIFRFKQEHSPDSLTQQFLFTELAHRSLYSRDCVQVSNHLSRSLEDVPLSEEIIALTPSDFFVYIRPSPQLRTVRGRWLLRDESDTQQLISQRALSSARMPAYSVLTVPEYPVPGSFAGVLSPELEMSPPPSLATGASTWSESSDLDFARYTLGTPRLYTPGEPGDHHAIASPVEARYSGHSDYLQIGVEIALEPEDGNRLEMFGTSKTGSVQGVTDKDCLLISIHVQNVVFPTRAHPFDCSQHPG